MLTRIGRLDLARLNALVPLLEQDRGIELAYLFGSYARNAANALSDVDVALLLAPSVSHDQYLDYRLRYFSTISELIHDDRVDVVVLNGKPPLLAHEAIKGRLLFERSPEARVAFVVDVQRRYLDLKYFYAIDYEYMRERLKEGRFGQP